jgi:hypothetical protein
MKTLKVEYITYKHGKKEFRIPILLNKYITYSKDLGRNKSFTALISDICDQIHDLEMKYYYPTDVVLWSVYVSALKKFGWLDEITPRRKKVFGLNVIETLVPDTCYVFVRK